MVRVITVIAIMALLVATSHGQSWNRNRRSGLVWNDGRPGFGSNRWDGGLSGIGWRSNWNNDRGFGSRGLVGRSDGGWRSDRSNLGSLRDQLTDLTIANRIAERETDSLLDRLDGSRNGRWTGRRDDRWSDFDRRA